MGKYDGYDLSSDDIDHDYNRNLLLRDIANELATANSIKKVEVMILAFDTGMPKTDRNDLIKELGDM